MKLNKIFLLRADFVSMFFFFALVGGVCSGKAIFPIYSGVFNVFLQIIVFLTVIFFCFCNLFVVSPWKEYLWFITFGIGLALSLIFTGEFNQHTIFCLWGIIAAVVCALAYKSKEYKGCLPKKNKTLLF